MIFIMMIKRWLFDVLKNYLCALSSSVPPHLSPRAMRADLSRSSPREASSSHEENADKSK